MMKNFKAELIIMKKLLSYTIFILLLNSAAYSQVMVSPYAALTDNNSKTAFITVSNNSLEPQEIRLTFKFAYEVSDDKGFTDVKYLKENEKSRFDLTPMLEVSENRFMLRPGEKREVEISIDAPADLPEGTYWTKILTSYKSKKALNEVAGENNFPILPVFSQVTTLIYKNYVYNASLNLEDVSINLENGFLKILSSCKVSGNPPFFAEADIKITDAENNVVKEKLDYFAVYFELKRGTIINISELEPGSYTLEVNVTNNKSGMPSPDNLSEPLTRKLEFAIP